MSSAKEIKKLEEVDNSTQFDNQQSDQEGKIASDIDLSQKRKLYVAMTNEKMDIIKNLVQNQEKSKKIADVVGISQRSAQRWIKKLAYESMETKKKGRKQISKQSLQNEIEMIVNDDCSLTLQGIADNMINEPIVSKSTVCRELKKMGYTRKRLKIVTQQANAAEIIEQRFAYSIHLAHIPDDVIIYLDETGFNLHTSQHFGYAPVGSHAVQTVPTNRGRNLSVLVAVTVYGVLTFGIQQQAYNTESMMEWINDFLLPLIENQTPTIIMDNARFHHANVVKNALSNAGCNVLYLPPYSPQLNPVEEIFSMIKARYRSIKPRPETTNEMIKEVENILIALTTYDMRAFYFNTRQWIEKARQKLEFT